MSDEIVEGRRELLQDVQASLTRLIKDVCPMCDAGKALLCEVVDGESAHVDCRCGASTIHRLKAHVDDIRHQFANEWNPDENPRVKWDCVVVNEGGGHDEP